MVLEPAQCEHGANDRQTVSRGSNLRVAPGRPAPKVHRDLDHAESRTDRLDREFGVDLGAVAATGPHGRILKEDVQVYVKGAQTQTLLQ